MTTPESFISMPSAATVSTAHSPGRVLVEWA
jgi:hypothetical protein